MTWRTYGKWPGWRVEAGWTEEQGGYYFCSISKFDGERETEFSIDALMRRQDITPKHIKEWLDGHAKRWPELKLPPGFIRCLWEDRGKVGFHVGVEYS